MKIIAIGDAALMDGFTLLGIKTYADASLEVINDVLTRLEKDHAERGLVFMQQELLRADIPMVKRLRNHGGRILICEIPGLLQVADFKSEVEQLVGRLMGNTVMEIKHGE
jgi:vacuolar-type H+-ATPase subunit F/Vma7